MDTTFSANILYIHKKHLSQTPCFGPINTFGDQCKYDVTAANNVIKRYSLKHKACGELKETY